MYEWLMGVEYDIYHDVVYFLLYLNCENYMKLLNCYGDVVGVYIGYVHKCCWWIFLHAIGVELLGVSMYWNMLCWLLKLYENMHCCSWVIGPHTVDVGFHIHVGDEYFVFNYSGWLFGLFMMFSWHQGWRPRSWFGITRV